MATNREKVNPVRDSSLNGVKIKEVKMISKRFIAAICLFFLFGVAAKGITSTRTAEGILSPISIYDEEYLLKISIEDVGKYHGDICPCVVVAFRATQLAISELWKNEIPQRENFKIISSLPTAGSEDTFEFITRVKRRKDFSYDLPEKTSNLITSEQNYSFVFVKKSTGKQIKVLVKKEIFQEINSNFFDIRTKIKLKKATQKDKKKFKLIKQKLKNIFMHFPINKLFR